MLSPFWKEKKISPNGAPTFIEGKTCRCCAPLWNKNTCQMAPPPRMKGKLDFAPPLKWSKISPNCAPTNKKGKKADGVSPSPLKHSKNTCRLAPPPTKKENKLDFASSLKREKKSPNGSLTFKDQKDKFCDPPPLKQSKNNCQMAPQPTKKGVRGGGADLNQVRINFYIFLHNKKCHIKLTLMNDINNWKANQ